MPSLPSLPSLPSPSLLRPSLMAGSDVFFQVELLPKRILFSRNWDRLTALSGLSQVKQFICAATLTAPGGSCATTWSNCWVLRGFISSNGRRG
jgi:hypothetical protein